MPRQPNPNQIQEAQLRPSMSPAQINIGVASATGAGGRALGAAISDLGNAFGQIAARSSAVTDETNDARYRLELSKREQDIYSDIEQNTDEKGSQWSTYGERYGQTAKELDEKYPVSDNKKKLNREIYTTERLQRNGLHALKNGRDMSLKYHQGIEEKELAGVAQRIQADPSEANFTELAGHAQDLIKSGLGAYYTNADVESRTRKVMGFLTMTRYQQLLKSDPEAAKGLLDQAAKGRYKLDMKDAGGGPATSPGPVEIEKYSGQRTVGRPRNREIRGVVLHYTEGGTNMDGLASWANKSNTGYNYYIDPKGKIIDFAGDAVMNHAGAGRGKAGDAARYLQNNNSVGIGLMTPKGGKATPEQIKAAHALSAKLAQEHGFSEKNVFGHGELAVGHRKSTEAMDAVEYIRKTGLSPKNGEVMPPEAGGQQPGNDNAPSDPGQPDVGKLLPADLQDRLNAVVDEDPETKLTGLISSKQRKALEESGIDADQMTVGQALELVQASGVADMAKQGAALSEGQQQPPGAEPTDLPQGLLAEGQTFTITSKKFGVMNFPAEGLNAIPRKMLSQMRRQATEQARIRTQEQQILADDMMSKQLQTVLDSGKSHSEWSPDIVREAYAKSPKKIAQFNRRLSVAKEVNGVVGGSDDLPNDALTERLSALEDKMINAEGDSDPYIAKAYKQAKSRVEKVLRTRDQDPALAVNASREVRDAMSQIPNGQVKTKQHVFGLVDARIRAQTRLGLAHTPITKREANDLLAPVAGAAPAQKMEAAKELARKVYKVYGRHAESVISAATRLSSLDSSDDRDMITTGQLFAAREAKAANKPASNPASSISDVDRATKIDNLPISGTWDIFGWGDKSGKAQGRASDAAPKRKNQFDQFE